MKLSSSTYFVLLLWPAIVHCSALDWHLPLIGYPIASPVHSFAHVANSPNSPPQAVILTVTDRNILAALNATTGAIGTWGFARDWIGAGVNNIFFMLQFGDIKSPRDQVLCNTSSARLAVRRRSQFA